MASEHEIPDDQLPEGFAERVEHVPDDPAPAVPAATVVLARDAHEAFEILLVRRSRASGFVPGAWVFPGGRVDPTDGDEHVLARTDGLTAEEARARLRLTPDAEPSAIAYFLAAAREAFEETGLLVGTMVDGAPAQPATDNERMDQARIAVLEDRVLFGDALAATGCRVDGGRIAYIGHWITPLAEPRRYDTRFFLAEVPAGSEPVIDPREMTDARWVTPAEALADHRQGRLPMVFPTIKTLEQLIVYRSVSRVIADFETREVPSILPRLVRTPTGVGIELPEPEAG